jgi:predicted ATPase/transcriptional regulator with XRE-family HTH domain
MQSSASFGRWLKLRRLAQDLTQTGLGELAGCSAMTIRKIEADERRPSRQLAERLAQYLAIPADERGAFLKAARSELRSDRLAPPFSEANHPLDGGARHRLQNLPTSPTPLIGREAELADLGALLENQACRLMTILGPGGIGKTRLALAAAAELADAFAGGAAFVPLQAIGSAAFVAPAILAAFTVVLQDQRDPIDQLLDYLGGKELLLVLDNLEQLLAPEQSQNGGIAELLAALLARAPGVTVLVTSRERLALDGEWLFDLSGLGYPAGEPSEGFEAYDAVRLFMQRARQVRRQFALSDGEARAVARICRLVEGLPLAIELAAAALRGRSVMAIADAIESSVRALAIELRAIPERQRSMWATFEHSWRMLSDEERQVFPRLSVFRGGFQEEAAAEVAQASTQLLTALLDKSLLRWDGTARYDMHELIRQYADEKLKQAGEAMDTRNRFAMYYLALAEIAEPALQGPQKRTWLDKLETELNNVRATLEWALEGGEIETGLRLAGALWLFWERQHNRHVIEAQAWLERLLAAGHTASVATRAKALYRAAWLAMSQWDFKRVEALSQQSLELCRDLGDKRGVAWSLFHLGDAANGFGDHAMASSLKQESTALFREVGERWGLAYMLTNQGHEAMMQNDYASMRSRLEEGMALWQELGDQDGIGQTLYILGEAAIDQGDYRSAAAHLEQSLALCREPEDKWSVATVLGKLGNVARCQSDFVAARSCYEQSLTLYREVGSRGGLAVTLGNLGLLAQDQGEPVRAIALCEESLKLWRELDDLWGIAWSLNILGHVAQRQGDDQRASALLIESLPLAWQRGDRAGVAWCLEGLASVAWAQEQPRRAARLFGAAEALRQTIGVPLPPVERANYKPSLARVCTLLDEATFAAAWAEGQVLTLEQAMAEALNR